MAAMRSSLAALCCIQAASRTTDLCAPVQPGEVEHQLDLSALPSTARVFVCDDRLPSRFVYVTGFYTQPELAELKRNPTGRPGGGPPRTKEEFLQFRAPPWVEDRVSRFLVIGNRSFDAWLEQGDASETVEGESLHHDRNYAADRFATMLSYVQAPASGGHTIFPYVGTRTGWGAARSEQDLKSLMALLPAQRELRSREGIVRSLQGFHANAAQRGGSRLPEIGRKLIKMCAAVRWAHGNATQYPYFAAAPEEGSAMFFWHWAKPQRQTSEDWVDVVPDWHPAGWHGRCAATGQRVVLRSFRHMTGLNCESDLEPTRTPPKRSDCAGFAEGACRNFSCERDGPDIMVTYRRPASWRDSISQLIMLMRRSIFGDGEL